MTRYARRVTGLAPSGVRKWFEGAGPGSINLTLGQPDFDTPAHIKEAACRALAEGKTGYTPNVGIPELREAIVEKTRRENGVDYTPDQVMVTAGASEALLLAMLAIVDDGDRVLHADPAFVSYASLASLAGGRPEGLALDDRLRIDVEAAKEQIDGAKLLVINSPSNPTGSVEPAGSVKALVEYAADAGTTVISDEVYEHFVYDGVTAVSAARFGENVVTINATSKTYAMTGWRLGYAVLPTPEEAQIFKTLNVNIISCTPPFIQLAGQEAIENPALTPIVADMVRQFEQRAEYVVQALNAIPGVTCAQPKGAFYVFPNIGGMIEKLGVLEAYASLPKDKQEKTSPSTMFQLFALYKHSVATMDRNSFGKLGTEGRHYLRLSTATDLESLKEGVRRMTAAGADRAGFAEYFKRGEHLGW